MSVCPPSILVYGVRDYINSVNLLIQITLKPWLEELALNSLLHGERSATGTTLFQPHRRILMLEVVYTS